MERVRVGLVGDDRGVPPDCNVLYERAALELREQANEGVAQSETIASILRIPLAGLSHFMQFFQCPFRILCDPRESREDKAVLRAIDEFFSGPMAAIAPNEAKLYLGMDNTLPSDQEIGLQLADLLTGEVRSFFDANPEFLISCASRTLITWNSRANIEVWETLMGNHGKAGTLEIIPPEIMARIERFSGESCIPFYRPSFAAGLLSCYTNLGQPRHIELYEGNFFQQTD